MENNESTPQAASRETREEACAEVLVGSLFSLIDVPHINQVHLFYLGTLIDGQHAPGEESLETTLLEESEIPWDTLAFRSVTETLRAYFADRDRGYFGVHTLQLAAQTLPSKATQR